MHLTTKFKPALACAAALAASMLLPGGGTVSTHSGHAATAAATAPRHVHACAGKITVPVGLTVTVPEETIAVGADVQVTVEVRADTDLGAGRIVVSTEGPVQLTSSATLDLQPLAKGERRVLHFPVRYTGDGVAAVRVQLTSETANGSTRFARMETLTTMWHQGRALCGCGGVLVLRNRAAQEDFQAGRITAKEFAAARHQLETLEAVNVSAVQTSPAQATDESLAAASTITVQGTVLWQDENGTTHPAYGMAVQVWDEDLLGDELVAQVATGVNGTYSFTIDNNDGLGAGGRDIYVRIRTANSAVTIEAPGGGPYERNSSTHEDVADGSVITENFTCLNTGNGISGGLITAASYVAAYAATLNGGAFLNQLEIEWPDPGATSYYNGSKIFIETLDRFDWDVLFHEYGHYVMDTFNIENNPGGAHNIGDCISDVRMSKSIGLRLAWGEGWPTFFGTVAQRQLNLASLGVPRVGDVNYDETEDSTFSYSLEAQDNQGLGEDNEVAVQRILWDLFDNAADGRDTISVSDLALFNPINAADPQTLSAAWAALRAGLSPAADLAFGAVATDHQVGPSLLSPANNSLVRPNASFSWARGAGCNPNTFGGDSFDLVFFHPGTLARILTLPGLASPNHALTLAEYQNLASQTRQVRFAVEARTGPAPATGPYLGENFLVTLNRPPTANAGPDQLTVECTSTAGALVTLNGLGSSDPDGDALTYTWTAPGILFNNPNSSTPSATFPKGAPISVNLTVSDGLETDTDTVSIHVVDTTPPTVVCPADITVECTEHGGTPATNPAIAAFLAGATISDLCDAAPTLTHNAPGFFPKGSTLVTWKGRDADGNTANCSARVNVVDTTPPVIKVSVTPDMLWSPNHKLADILATVTVTDICDPHPTFVLTSITSNEPQNGLGDGNTSPDIQAATLNTPDVSFKVRAERAGVLRDRVYTITYTARDEAGNTAMAKATVTVPHNR